MDGNPFKAFAEAETYLTIPKSLLGPHVWLSVGAPLAGKGTSNIFNEVFSQDAFVPANASSATIHTHPDPGRLDFDYHGFPQSSNGIPGPSSNDYPASFMPYRNVVVDPNYIYLFNSNPDQTIIFKRP